ncbi:MAG TPA: DUF4058 family protein [Gemmataceae bacterium]|nr:DUF4058 family protein [Gemmataceae bacterium]
MPSPFPGMDPYLEDPYIWPDFHNSLAGHIRDELNGALPAPYYARLDMRPEIGIVEPGMGARRIVPDVAVARPSSPPATAGVAVLHAPRRMISASKTVTVRSEPIRHAYVEVRDPTRGHQLITLIEIVSPSNKRRGDDRTAYLQKQREVLDSDANLIELDLLRSGERLVSSPFLEDAVLRLEPVPDYLVLVNRAWQRAGLDRAYQIFPILLSETLPCIPVPLREGQTETPLDLQYAFQRAYDGGPYRRGGVNYDEPPQPALHGEWAAWADECIRAWRAA